MLYETGANTSRASATTDDCHLYRILVDWVEAQVTWNIWKTGANWTTAGCSSDGSDRYATPVSTLALPRSTTGGGWRTWGGLASTVAAWRNGTLSNYGMLLACPTKEFIGVADADWRTFASSDSTTDASLRPKLVVTYVVNATAAIAPASSVAAGTAITVTAIRNASVAITAVVAVATGTQVTAMGETNVTSVITRATAAASGAGVISGGGCTAEIRAGPSTASGTAFSVYFGQQASLRAGSATASGWWIIGPVDWHERAPSAASWSTRNPSSATWSERTPTAATWRTRTSLPPSGR